MKKDFTKEDQKKYFESRQKKYSGDIRAPVIKKLSKRYIGKKVLDVGAGSGALINLIPNSIGIDLAPNNLKIKKGDITKLPFQSNFFDTIFTLEVLEHLDDETLHNGLEEVKRSLSKGGYFIVTVPYKENLKEGMVFCPYCNTWFHKNGHVRSFDENSIKNLLQKYGFKVILLKILPLGSFGRHSFLKLFWRMFNFFGLGFKPESIFLIAQKSS